MTNTGMDGPYFEGPDGERVPFSGNCSIGRSSSNEIVLRDDRVSRRHALIHLQEADEYWLVDLGSGNGTYLNGRRLVRPTRLNDGDQIEIAEYRQIFRQASRTPESVTLTSAKSTVLSIQTVRYWLVVADLENSVRLSQSLPPDRLPVVVGRWLGACKELIEEFDGVLNKFLGDGFLAYWPDREGAEANVARALTALKRLQAQSEPPFRVVVHLGDVVTGGPSALGEESLSGREVNFVFRLEKLAGSLGEPFLLSQPAAERLRPTFPSREAGVHSLPSFSGQFALFAG